MEKKLTLTQQFEAIEKGTEAILEQTHCFYFYDWFCKDSSLERKLFKLLPKIKQFVKDAEIDKDKHYFFLKNNCPMVGKLYDDFRICDVETGEVVWTVSPAVGYTATYGQAQLWGKINDFNEAVVAGTWTDIIAYIENLVEAKKKKPHELENDRNS